MPTSVQKRGSGYVVVEDSTGKVKSRHATRAAAEASSRIRDEAVEEKLRRRR